MVLKGCFNVGMSLCRLHVTNVFDVRAGFDVDASRIFPQGVLDAITLIGDVVGFGGPKAYPGCKAGLPFCSMTVTVLPGVESTPNLLESNPEGQA